MADPNQPINIDNETSAKIIAQAWSDDEFKKRLIANPNEVLLEAGVSIPAGASFKVIEGQGIWGKDYEYILYLPPKPDAAEIGVRDLTSIAATKCTGTWHNLCGCS